jgi:hypothetical protein
MHEKLAGAELRTVRVYFSFKPKKTAKRAEMNDQMSDR